MKAKAFRHLLAVAFAITSVLLNGHLGHVAHGALIAGWDFQTTATGGTALNASDAAQPQVFNANFGTGTLYLNGTNGSSVWVSSTTTSRELNAFSGTPVNATNGLSTTTTSPAALALVNSSANNKSMVFKFSMFGYQDLVISLASQRTSSGFTSLLWEYSSDGTNYSSIGTLSSGVVAGTITGTFAVSGTLTLPTVTGFNNATDAYLRVTGNGASSSTGNVRVDNIQLNASTYVPLASILTWSGNGSTAGGSGSWTTTGTSWSTTGAAPFSSTWSGSNKAVFGTSGGTVTVDAAGISAASGIDFEVTGYTLTGGTLTLTGPTAGSNVITTGTGAGAASVTTTINSVLAGTGGLTKLGAGTLVLGGVNTFSGTLAISAGTLEVGADSALGDPGTDISLGGTLKTTASISMGAGRDVTGSGTLDIAPGTTLTSSGSFNLTATTLSNAGTLDLQGATRSLGSLTFGTAATVNGSGAISLTGLTASGVTSGSAIVNPAIVFTSGDKTTDVGTGGTLVLNGDISGAGARIAKTGAGTLIASGSNTTSGYRVGAAGATPTNGGTVILAAAAASGTSQLQLNYGTLDSTAPFTFANGVSIGGRAGAVAVLGGTNAMTFSGSSSFFRGTATSGELRLDVNNSTTFAGVLGPTSGGGSATGVTIGGIGALTIAGNAATFVDTITLQDTVDLMVNETLGGGVNVASATLLGGTGTINGAVQVLGGGILAPGPISGPGTLTIANVLTGTSASNYFFDLSATNQTIGGGINDLVTGITNLTLDGVLNVNGIGDFSTVTAGTVWRLFNYTGTLTDNTLSLGLMPTLSGANTFAIDTSTPGQVNLQVVPEPGAVVLAGLGGLLAAGFAARRRRRAV